MTLFGGSDGRCIAIDAQESDNSEKETPFLLPP